MNFDKQRGHGFPILIPYQPIYQVAALNLVEKVILQAEPHLQEKNSLLLITNPRKTM